MEGVKLANREWISEGDERDREWTFRVLQWNTLADALAPSGPDHNFLRCTPHCLEWSYRGPRLLAEILRSQADIVCLEEVDHYHDFFLPRLAEHGYAGLWRAKAKSPCSHQEPNNGPDGCALFYRTSHFSLLESRELVLRDAQEKETDQVAILAQLQPQVPGLPPVCVAVTHLKAKGGFDALRLAQGRHLQTEMEAFAIGQPTIICGDFNASPKEPVYQQLSGGLRSAYFRDNQEPVFTTWKFRPAREDKHTIDYIWYSSGSLELCQVWAIPSEQEIGDAALPCPKYPSDHVSLCAAFALLTQP